jgi:uncharacterized protein (UPF0548 family)
MSLTYSPPRETDARQRIGRYRTMSGTVELGKGGFVFEKAVANARQWKVHERDGLLVTPKDARVQEGSCVVLLISISVIYVTVACRVVSTFETDTRWEFSYGTLPHHVERGEESFSIEHASDDTVRFTVRAWSRPGHLWTSIGAPITRAVQRKALNHYLQAMVDLVTLDTR